MDKQEHLERHITEVVQKYSEYLQTQLDVAKPRQGDFDSSYITKMEKARENWKDSSNRYHELLSEFKHQK